MQEESGPSVIVPLQQRLQVVTDSGTLAMWEVDLRTGQLTWSARGEKLLGLPPDYNAETLQGLMAFVHPEDRERVERVLAESVASKVTERRERFRVVRADGSIRHVSSYVEFVDFDEEGPRKMVGFALDISDLAEYEERLRDTDERLRTAYEAAKVWTWRIDLDSWSISRPLQTSDANSPQYGAKQSFGDWVEKVHPEDRARVEAGMHRAIASGELWEDEFRLRWPDGTYHWIHDRGKKIELPGSALIFSGAAMVIDERKRVEQQLVENEERLRSAYMAGKMWPWELELSSGKLRLSDDFGLYSGPGTTSSITVAEWMAGVHPEDRARVQSAMDLAVKEAGTYSCEYRLRWSDGSYHWLNSRGGLIRDTRGVLKLMGIARDCTEEKETAQALEESERLRLVALEAAQMGVFFQNMKTGQIRWSERQFDIFGIRHSDFTGDKEDFHKLVLPEDMEALVREHERLIKKHAQKFRHEFRIKRPSDGKVRWIAVVGEMTYDESGEVATMMGVNYDTTDSKLHDQELRASEKLRSIAIGAAEMGVWRQDLATGQVTWTERQFELFGVSQEQFDGSAAKAFQNMHPDDRTRLAKECEAVVTAHGSRHITEFRINKPGGGVRWLAAVGEILYDDTTGTLQSIGVNFDITARKQQEEAVRESERLRRLALSAARMGAFEWNVITGEIVWSPEQYELLRLDPQKFAPTLELFESCVHPEDLPHMQLLMQLLNEKQERRYRYEFRVRWPDGSIRWVHTLGEFVYDSAGKVVRMYGVNWDVTDQKETEQQIIQLNRELQHKVADFEALMHAMPVAVSVGMDPQLKDVRVNPTFAQLLGLEDPNQNVSLVQDRPVSFRIQREGKELPIEELPQHKAAKLKQEVRNEEFELITGAGRKIDMYGHAVPILDESGAVRGTLAAYMDITERKRAEQALRTGEKLATAGKMAASLAHEINNPLAAVTNLLYLVSQDESASESSKRFIAMATSELARVSQITRNVLAFYRETNQPIEVDIGDLMSSILELYSPRIRDSQVAVQFQRNGPCKIVAYPGELRQVFSNFIVNAIDAMPTGGRLHIRIREGCDGSNRRGARLLIADSGVGIPSDQVNRLFEPFFTTKGEKGTGLGLWVSRDIINKHNGTIRLRTSSLPGRSGTCFSLFFPSGSVAVRKHPNLNAASVSHSL